MLNRSFVLTPEGSVNSIRCYFRLNPWSKVSGNILWHSELRQSGHMIHACRALNTEGVGRVNFAPFHTSHSDPKLDLETTAL